MAWFAEFLVRYPELALFLVISIGYLIGRVRIAGFSLGPVTGSLFAGILIGQFAHVPVSGMAKSFLFLLFLFGIGYSVGPQFVQALKRDGLKPVLLAIICCVTGLLTAITVAKTLGLDAGFAAGLVSGALTESPAMGTATEAINALPLPPEERARLVAHIAVADAVCYVFGAVGAILFCSVVGPRLLGIDLKAEALALERELGITRRPPGTISAWRRIEARAYRVPEGAAVIGLTIAAAEARSGVHRLFVERVRRNGELLEGTPELVLAVGDVVAVTGPRAALLEVVGPLAEEVEDQELLDIPVSLVDVLLTSAEVAGRSVAELAREPGARSLFLRGVRRGGNRWARRSPATAWCWSAGTCSASPGPPPPWRVRPRASARWWRRSPARISSCWASPSSWAGWPACWSPSPWAGCRSRSAPAWARCWPGSSSAICVRASRSSAASRMTPSR